MASFEKLLVAVDQSEYSDRALQVACDLAHLSKGEIRILHVREHEAFVGSRSSGQEVEGEEDAEKLLTKELAVVRQAGIPVAAEVRRAVLGHVAAEIVGAAEGASADAVVMGTRGRSELTALVLGSNAFKVLHLAKCPVVVVR